MRFFLARLSAAALLLISFPALPASGTELSNVESCKIRQSDQSQILRMGWPKYPGLIDSKGSPKFLVVGIDFVDAPMKDYSAIHISDVLELDKITERYDFVSLGQFTPKFEVYPEWVRMPSPSSHYGQDRERVEFVEGEWSTHHLTHDLTNQLIGMRNLKDYQGLILFVSKGDVLSGRSAYATILDKHIKEISGGPGNYIVIGRGWESEDRVEVWRAIVHELNHLLGLPDLYLYEPDGYWQGRTPGPFGQQAFIFNSSSDSLGWNRLLNGWIPENQILCLTDTRGIEKVYLSPPNDGDESGKQLVIYRLSESKVLVIGALNSQGYDARTYENSVLVYLVDSSVKSGEGPVTIIPRPTPLTLAPLSPSLPDWERFVEAPLIPKSYLEYGEFLIVNEAPKDKGAIVSVYVGDAKAKMKIELNNQAKAEEPKVEPSPTPVAKKKTIICTKGSKVLKVKAINPKCPKGYKKK